ncbi:MAG: hypothetical protein KGI50_06815 [Patescibacteria group bacterium]|nr:hypothetical protein [Patescibacteria group bacterium]MDE2439293.1 hypothetical protein [Patescibacteria group bacterium]
MLTDIQKRWIDALRSGKYKKGKKFLCSHGHYCCLGVACVILGLEGKESVGSVYFGGRNRVFAPNAVKELGLRSPLGLLKEPHKDLVSLGDMNDRGDFTFEQIADYIEANPGNVFVQ